MTDSVLCLSLWQPWASLVVLGHKRLETRSWATAYRGPLAIHAARHWNGELVALCLTPPFRALLDPRHELVWNAHVCPLPTGAVLGVVELVDCLPIRPERGSRFAAPCVAVDDEGIVRVWEPARVLGQALHTGTAWPITAEHEAALGDYTPLRWAWLLDHARALPVPVPLPGRQRLFSIPRALLGVEEPHQ